MILERVGVRPRGGRRAHPPHPTRASRPQRVHRNTQLTARVQR